MALNGWIKAHRQLLDHWVSQEPELFAFWMRLLLEANHTEVKKMFNGSLVTIGRGQVVFGLEAFEAKSGITKKKLRRYLKMLENEGMVGRQVTNKCSIISIINYEDYQDEGRQRASQGQSEGKPRASQGQHRKNVENEENVKNNTGAAAIDYSKWPEMPDEQILKDWIASRKKAKATHSQTAINTVGSELHKANAMGFSVNDCLSEAVTRGWRGFKAEWMRNSVASTGPASQPTPSHRSEMPRPDRPDRRQ